MLLFDHLVQVGPKVAPVSWYAEGGEAISLHPFVSLLAIPVSKREEKGRKEHGPNLSLEGLALNWAPCKVTKVT